MAVAPRGIRQHGLCLVEQRQVGLTPALRTTGWSSTAEKRSLGFVEDAEGCHLCHDTLAEDSSYDRGRGACRPDTIENTLQHAVSAQIPGDIFNVDHRRSSLRQDSRHRPRDGTSEAGALGTDYPPGLQR